MQLFDQYNQIQMRLIRVLLLREGKYNLLPELFDLVGPELFADLLNAFCGMELTFPDEKKIREVSKDVVSYTRIRRAEAGHRWRIVQELAHEFMVEPDNIWKRYNATKDLIEKHLRLGKAV